MKRFLNISGLLLIICLWSACNPDDIIPDGYVDEALLDEWTLESFEKLNGDTYKPKTMLPRDIVLVFRQGGILSGNITSFSIDGEYAINESGKMKLYNLVYDDLTLCCDWDEYFFDAVEQEQVHQYKITEDNRLLLYFDDDEPKIMRFTSSKNIKYAYIDYDLLDEWTFLQFEDIFGNVIHEKPSYIPNDMYIVFRIDGKAAANIMSYSSEDGFYKIDKEGKILLHINFPFLNTNFEWDDIFLAALKTVESYNTYEDGSDRFLNLFYEDSTKVLVFSNY